MCACTCTCAGADATLLQPYELDTAALSAKPCSIQLVLLPYGEFKQAKGAYRRSVGHAPPLMSAVCALHQAPAAAQRPGLLAACPCPVSHGSCATVSRVALCCACWHDVLPAWLA